MKANRILSLLLMCAVLLFAVSCGKSETKDYSTDASYAALFSEEDDEAAKQLKNILIAQNVSFNTGDAEGYYRLFQMTDEDKQFNISSYESISALYKRSYTLESIVTTFINEENAQALLTYVDEATELATGETVYKNRMQITYTMVLERGDWIIFEQEEAMLDDLMTVSEESEAVS